MHRLLEALRLFYVCCKINCVIFQRQSNIGSYILAVKEERIVGYHTYIFYKTDDIKISAINMRIIALCAETRNNKRQALTGP